MQGSGEESAVSAIDLHVRVADAQGLRLLPGGEIRLVITLRSGRDLQGEFFGAKVTPWLQVPRDQAPQWKARGAIFSVSVAKCCDADFQDSAHLHVSLMQRGHAVPEKAAPAPAKGLLASMKQKGKALQSASSTLAWPLGSSQAAAKGEEVGALSLNVGKQLACADGALAEECSEWLQLQTQEPGKGKGWLLLEIAALPCRPEGAEAPSTEPARASSQSPQQPSGAGVGMPQASTAGSVAMSGGAQASAGGLDMSSEEEQRRQQAEDAEASSSGLEEEERAASEVQEGSGGPGDEDFSESDAETLGESGGLPAAASLDLLSPQALSELLGSALELRPSQWLPFGKVPRVSLPAMDDFDWNIFRINDEPGGPEGDDRSLQKMLRGWSQPEKKIRKMKQRIDPRLRKQRREARKWRQWQEVFCILNDIERQLTSAVELFAQAAASMQRFGEGYASLQDDFPRLTTFLGDTALYFKSEAAIPDRLEEDLRELELRADEFRSISVEEAENSSAVEQDPVAREGLVELCVACEDLQVDVAVLLESTLMAAQQALAEYKRLHCRLELLATEYEPLCRLELESKSPVVLLPLLTERADQAAAASLPDQAVQWALDFSQLVGRASWGLQRLVRELERRKAQLKSCCEELRGLMLRCAACGGQPREYKERPAEIAARLDA